MSLQLDENHNNDNKLDEFQNPNPTLDTQSTDLTVDSKALMVPTKPVEEQDTPHDTEQDPTYLIQGSLTLSTATITIPQAPKYLEIKIHHPSPNVIHILLPPYLNNQVLLKTILMV